MRALAALTCVAAVAGWSHRSTRPFATRSAMTAARELDAPAAREELDAPAARHITLISGFESFNLALYRELSLIHISEPTRPY